MSNKKQASLFDEEPEGKPEPIIIKEKPLDSIVRLTNMENHDKGIKNVLALDIATHTGWCTRTASGAWNLTPKRDESTGMRIIRFKAKVLEVIKSEAINMISFERPAGKYKGSIIVQSELQGVLKMICEEFKIDYCAYSAADIKKFATGKGNAGKPEMIKAAKQKYGMQSDDDNEADAIHLYHKTIYDLNLPIDGK